MGSMRQSVSVETMCCRQQQQQRRRSSAVAASASGGDVVQQINGDFGRWQLRTILLIFLCKIPTAWFMACIIYTAPYPQRGELVCHSASWNGSESSSSSGGSNMLHSRNTDRLFSVQVCNAYAQSLSQRFVQRYGQSWNSSQESLSCNKIEHNTEYKSLITQFDLICSRRVLVALTQSFHALGALVGGLLAYQALQ